jgi:hypothetical protein
VPRCRKGGRYDFFVFAGCRRIGTGSAAKRLPKKIYRVKIAEEVGCFPVQAMEPAAGLNRRLQERVSNNPEGPRQYTWHLRTNRSLPETTGCL